MPDKGDKTINSSQTDSTSEDKIDESSVFMSRYQINSMVGHGGVGRVFLAFDKNVERNVAVKELAIDKEHPRHNVALARLIKEAKITGNLEHPSVVPVYDLGVKDDGSTFYVMKYVKGLTLFEVLQKCLLEDEIEAFNKRMKLLDNLIDVCEAMSYAHSKHIVHRDLKPGNIIVGEFGETIILDWGIAKRISGKDEEYVDVPGEPEISQEEGFTETGKLLGTPSYMPPEQADDSWGTIDQRSDVYSLGVVLFMILTGEKPYDRSAGPVLEQVTSEEPSPSPKDRSGLVPPELSAICEKAMAKSKDDRFNNAGELAAELKAYRDGRLVSVYGYSKKELFKRFVSRNKPAIFAVFAVIVAIIIGAGLAVDFGLETRKARRKAENALVDVTALSQGGIEYSLKARSEIESYFGFLQDEMSKAAKGLSKVSFKNQKIIQDYLKKLYSQFPNVLAFQLVEKPGKIVSVYPDSSIDGVGLDISNQTHVQALFKGEPYYISKVFETVQGFHAVVMQYPVVRGKKIVGSVSALMNIGKMMSSILSVNPEETDYRIWIMQDDGYILYSENENRIGDQLFSGEINEQFPEILKFGKRMQRDEWGVGSYSFEDEENYDTIYKVAVWDTIEAINKVAWKIVVTHTYMIDKKRHVLEAIWPEE